MESSVYNNVNKTSKSFPTMIDLFQIYRNGKLSAIIAKQDNRAIYYDKYVHGSNRLLLDS
jgi:hypothetical protein